MSSRAQPLQSVLPHQFLTLRLGVTVKHFNNAPERCSSSQISAFSRSPLQPAAFARMCQRSASATFTPQHRHQLVIFIQSELTRATSASCVQLQSYPLLGRACTSEWLQPHLPQHRHHTSDIERQRAMQRAPPTRIRVQLLRAPAAPAPADQCCIACTAKLCVGG